MNSMKYIIYDDGRYSYVHADDDMVLIYEERKKSLALNKNYNIVDELPDKYKNYEQ